jgi:ligand-binding sensor domain-containing protein/signal transduction histidine kinase
MTFMSSCYYLILMNEILLYIKNICLPYSIKTILVFFLFSIELFAQSPVWRPFLTEPELCFEEVGTKNSEFSLPNIYSITQTSDGYIWLGTRSNLICFNGYDFEIIEEEKLPFKINCFLEDENHKLLAGTDAGLYVIKNKKIIPAPVFDSISNISINALFKASDGTMWIGTGRGLYFFDNKILVKYTDIKNISISSIAQDGKGTIWVGTAGSGIYLIQNGKIIGRYYLSHGLPTSAVTSIIADRKNEVWVGTKKGLICFNDSKSKSYNQENGLYNPVVNYILEDRKSNIWIGTEGGVFLFSNNKFTRFSYNEGLSNDLTYCLFEDREGNLYVGSHCNTLNKLKKSRMKLYNTRHGLSSSWMWSILQDRKNNIWTGTNGNGADEISNGKITNYSIKNGLPANNIRTIGEDKNGGIWFGTSIAGVCKLQNGKMTIYNTKNGIAGNIIRSIYSDKKGNLWIGTNSGLTKYDFKKFTSYTTKDGLSNNTIRCFAEDKNGKLLIGTSRGMSIFENGKITNYLVKNGLSDSLVFSIAVDSANTYWIGTYNNGFNRMKDGKIFQFTMAAGLINNTVYQIFIVNNSDLVVSCNIGIYSIKIKDLNDYADGKIHGPLKSIIYEKESGSSSLECNGGNQPSGWKLRNGEIWISTLSGIAAINPEKTEVNTNLPHTVIDKVSIDKKNLIFDNSIDVPPGFDFITIEYSALSYSNPKKNRYKYMIEGLDKKWIDVGTQNVAYLSNLPYGKYYFKVISSNNDGLWSEIPAVLELNINPYFYQTKWFIVFLLASVSSLVYTGYRMRINRMKKRESELLNLVKERTDNLLESEKMVKSLIDSKEKFFSIITHDMKNLFTALLFYSKELYQNFSNLTNEKSVEYTQKINISASSLFELFNNLLIWSKIQTGTLELKSDKIDLNLVIASAYHSFIDHSKRKNIKLESEISQNIFVLMDRNMLMMIMNNLIFNALKLAKSDTSIRIYSEEIDAGILKISVENTGISIKKEELEKIFNDHSIRNISNTQNEWSTALGLLLCKELIEKNKGTFSVNSIPGKGNIISFTITKG